MYISKQNSAAMMHPRFLIIDNNLDLDDMYRKKKYNEERWTLCREGNF